MMVELSVEYARRTRLDGTDYDNRQQNVKINISTHNRSTSVDYKEMTGYLYVVAEDVTQRGKYKLIIKEEHKLDILRGQRSQLESQEVLLKYDDNPPVKFGFKCYGYVYVVEDKEGKILMGYASSDKLWDWLPKLSEKKVDEVFSF